MMDAEKDEIEAFKARRRVWLDVEADRLGLNRDAFERAVEASDKSHKGGFGDGYTLNLAKSIAAYLSAIRTPEQSQEGK